jgi:hypothetical protein
VTGPSRVRARRGLVRSMAVLILGAVAANINLAIANVALPSIGAAPDTSQAQLNLVAVDSPLGWPRRCCIWVRWPTATVANRP